MGTSTGAGALVVIIIVLSFNIYGVNKKGPCGPFLVASEKPCSD
jgi:hypothetical protein